MINRLNGLFSSENWLINRWQLPLAGLLLTVGMVTTISTLQAAPGQQKSKAAKSTVSSTTVTPQFEAKSSQLSEQAVDSSTPTAPIASAVAPQPSEQTVNSTTTVVPSVPATAPEPAVNSTTVASNFDATAPEPSEQAVNATTVAPTYQATVPQKATKAMKSTKKAMKTATVTSDFKAAATQKPGSDVDANGDAKSAAMPAAKWNRQAQESSKTAVAQAPATDAQIPDGTYLYGQSSEPQQNGKEYLVFQANQGKVVGAMYLPNSEYSCFHGTLDSRQMNLTVVNPYDQSAFSHTIARLQPAQIAAAGGQIDLQNTYDSLTYPYAVGLEGYQPVREISANDKQLLNTCMTEYQTKFEHQ